MGVRYEVVDVLVKPREVLDRRSVQHLNASGCAVPNCLKDIVDGANVRNDVEMEVAVSGVEEKGGRVEREVVDVDLADVVSRVVDEWAHQIMLQAVRRSSTSE